jgi:hypothetical protein
MAIKTKTTYPYVNKNGTKKKRQETWENYTVDKPLNEVKKEVLKQPLGRNYVQKTVTASRRGKKATAKGKIEGYSVGARGKSMYVPGKKEK